MSLSESQIRVIVRDELRKILDKGLMYSDEVKTQEPKQSEFKFSDEVMHLVTAELQGNTWIVHSKHFLQIDDFARVSEEVKKHGGNYVSSGRDSHWTVPA